MNEHAEPEPRELDVQETRRRLRSVSAARFAVRRTTAPGRASTTCSGAIPSAHLLLELLRGLAAPRVLVIGSYRSEKPRAAAARFYCLRWATGRLQPFASSRCARSSRAMRSVWPRMIHAAGAISSEHTPSASRVSRPAARSYQALVQYHQTRGWRAEDGPVSLDELVLACVAELPDQPLVAAGGRRGSAARAAGQPHAARLTVRPAHCPYCARRG